MNNLFVRGIRLNRDRVESFDEYPFNIPIINGLTEISFEKPVTFMVGENGVGKSTVIEALAVCMGLSPEGGSRNMVYESFNTTSVLHEYLTVLKSGVPPKWKFFLRAESFYTMANAFEEYRFSGGYVPPSMHERSHGEEFNTLLDDFQSKGFYILDEPESALSPRNQMRMLCRLHELANNGTQFIIATHSPILLSYYDADIMSLDDGFKKIAYKDTEIYRVYKRFLECPEKMQKYLFED